MLNLGFLRTLFGRYITLRLKHSQFFVIINKRNCESELMSLTIEQMGLKFEAKLTGYYYI